jgi:hypothetical protein
LQDAARDTRAADGATDAPLSPPTPDAEPTAPGASDTGAASGDAGSSPGDLGAELPGTKVDAAVPIPDAAVGGAGGAAPDAGARGGGAGAGGAGGNGAGGSGGAPVPALAFTLEKVAPWRGDAKGAYSMIHDDVCDPSAEGALTFAEPELTKRGLRAGFGAIVGACVNENKWGALKTVVAHGHDVFSHSWDHSCLGSGAECAGNGGATGDLAQQIDEAGELLEENLDIAVRYFVFPYDVCGASALDRLKDRGYLGARCGDRGRNPRGFPASANFANRFDVWGPNFSVYAERGPCQGETEPYKDGLPSDLPVACRRYVLNQYVEDVITDGGWGIRELHGMDEDRAAGAFQPVSRADYTAHLDWLSAKVTAGEVWVDGPTPVLRYRWARELCAPPAIVGGTTLQFPSPSDPCKTYATALTFILVATGADPAGLSIEQAGKSLPVRKLAPGRFAVDADPTRGDAVVRVK